MSDNPILSWFRPAEAKYVVIADEAGNVLARIPVEPGPGRQQVQVPPDIIETGKSYQFWTETV